MLRLNPFGVVFTLCENLRRWRRAGRVELIRHAPHPSCSRAPHWREHAPRTNEGQR